MEHLQWGRRYVMVEPNHFRVQPDPALAMTQWRELVTRIERLGGTVDTLPQRADSPDMVYAMNLGLALVRTDGQPHVVMSHMRHPQRRMETSSARPWFAEHGFTTSYVGREGIGAHLEAGDAFAFGDALVVGYGRRTEELALKHLATEMGVRVRGLRLTHAGVSHLDLAFCPLDQRRAMVFPSAFDDASARALLELVPEPLVLTEEEALTTFCAGSIVIGGTVLMPACPDRVRAQLEEWGFEVVLVDVSEFHKGGGSLRSLANPVDVVIGRDLPELPVGEVVLPSLS